MSQYSNRELFRALVGDYQDSGSSSSERNYSVIVLPSFDNLYNGVSVNKHVKEGSNHLDYLDIRLFAKGLKNCNMQALETLCNPYKEISCNLNSTISTRLKGLLERKNDIARLDLSLLFKVCMQIYHASHGMFCRHTAEVNCSELYDCVRMLNFLKRYADINFSSFSDALYCNDTDIHKNALEYSSNGKVSNEYFLKVNKDLSDEIYAKYEKLYMSAEVNVELKKYIDEQAIEIVKSSLLKSIEDTQC